MTRTFTFTKAPTLQIGLVGYEQRQTTATTGPAITPEETTERYAVNALGVGSNVTFWKRKVNLDCFVNREQPDCLTCVQGEGYE
jgi:hypothetical protein